MSGLEILRTLGEIKEWFGFEDMTWRVLGMIHNTVLTKREKIIRKTMLEMINLLNEFIYYVYVILQSTNNFLSTTGYIFSSCSFGPLF